VSGPSFEDVVGEGLDPGEGERLRRTHDLLVAAGPPPELPPSLASPPGSTEHAEATRALPRGIPRRRVVASLVLAAALALAAFGAGFLVGNRDQPASWTTDFVLAMQGTAAAPAAHASLDVAPIDADGNWPMILTVRGLPELPAGRSYELLLTRKGTPVASCGTFLVGGEKSEVYLNAPYKLRTFDGWAITRQGSSEILLRTERI
jgi:Anti-sigma-K factor rskA, C-terminal